MKKNNFVKFSLLLNTFFVFGGYYSLQIGLLSFGITESRAITIPYRVFVVIVMVLTILVARKGKRLLKYLLLPGIFWLIYLTKAFFYASYSIELVYEKILFIVSFSLIPFVFFLFSWEEYLTKLVKTSVIASSIILSSLTIYFYGSFIAQGVGRIDMAEYLVEGFVAINPLSLAYTGAILIGLNMFNIVNKNGSLALNTIGVLLGLIPFLLGSSRGAIIALVLPFLIYGLVHKRVKVKFLSTLSIFITGILLVVFSELIGSNIFDRVSQLFSGSSGSSGSSGGGLSNIRVNIWDAAIQQFLENPFLGSGFYVYDYDIYPHNLIIESFMTTGIVGGLAFFIFIALNFIKSIQLIRNQSKNTWIAILFIQVFVQGMVTGAIYSSIWFWSISGILMSCKIRK